LKGHFKRIPLKSNWLSWSDPLPIGDHTQKGLALPDGLEEIVEFVLIGPLNQVYEEEDDVVEREEAVAGEAFGADAV
jgi:hypothetical protein